MVGERRRLGRRRARLRRVLRVGLPLVVLSVLVVLIASAVHQIGPASGAYRRSLDRSYAALVGPVALSSNAAGTEARALLTEAPTLGRVTLFARLDALAADTAATVRRLAVAGDPGPATSAAARCTDALDDRARAGAELRAALEGVLGGRTGLGPADQASAAAGVTGAIEAMQRGDASWAACRRGIRRAPGGARLVRSVWLVHGGGLSARGVIDLVAAVAGSPSLTAQHRLAVLAIVTDPAAVLTGATLVVIPSTTLTVSAVIADQGNVDEPGVEVGGAAQLQGAPASPPPAQHTLALAAGGSSSVTLPGFKVSPGSSYTVVVTAESPRAEGTGPIASRSLAVEVQPAGTETAVSAPGRVRAGQPVTFTTAVTSSLAGSGDPTGTVAFQDDGATIGACAAQPVRRGLATCTVTYPSAGTHAIGAVYAGTDRFATSTSAAVTLQVAPG